MGTKNHKGHIGHIGQQSFMSIRVLRGSSFFVGLVACFALSMAACGGPQIAAPTAIPAEITVPDQPAPIYADDATRFTLATPAPPVFPDSGVRSENSVSAGAMDRPEIVLPYEQMPSALGVVRGGAVLRDAPDGRQIGSIPVGGTVTITGKTDEGRAYAVFSHDGLAGWLAASAVTVYGGDDLVVVNSAVGPGPVATLMAEAMRPIEPSVLEGVGIGE